MQRLTHDGGHDAVVDESESAWQRTLWVAAIAQTFSILGFNCVIPFLPLYVQHLGVHGAAGVTLWAAILSGGSAICMAVTAPIWGVLADRYGRKIMVARSMASAALLIALMGLVQNVYQLLVLRMLQGMFTGTVSASQALIASQAPRERLGFSLGVMQTAVYVGTSVGPLLGGVVADALGFRPTFVAAGALLFVGACIVILFIQEERRFAEHRGGSRPKLVAGMREALEIPVLPAMIGTVFAVQFGITIVFPILPQFVQYLQGPADHAATVTGLVLGAAGVAGAIASVSTGFLSDRLGYRFVLVGASLAAALLSAPQFAVTATWELFVLRVLVGFALGAILPAVSALTATLVPAEKRGTAYGLTGSATAIGFGAGPLAAAAVVDVAGIRAVFVTAALVLGVIGAWVGMMVTIPEEADRPYVPIHASAAEETPDTAPPSREQDSAPTRGQERA